jgi:hypothetical protein
MQKIDWIKYQLQPAESASQATSRLNTLSTIDNPIPQSQIPKPIDLAEIRAVVPDTEAFNVLSSRIWDRIVESIAKGDLAAVQGHIKALYAGKLISQETIAKLAPFLSATMLDPSWQQTIETTPARAAGFDDVMVHEVQEAIDAA